METMACRSLRPTLAELIFFANALSYVATIRRQIFHYGNNSATLFPKPVPSIRNQDSKAVEV